jgi:hypothetical protein
LPTGTRAECAAVESWHHHCKQARDGIHALPKGSPVPSQTEKQATVRRTRLALFAARSGLTSIRSRLRRGQCSRDEIKRDLDKVKAELDRAGSILEG